tara:strand:+ start:3006 stop:4565 length:1560 start_codon:yes stop_codon:yes gene_type:complete
MNLLKIGVIMALGTAVMGCAGTKMPDDDELLKSQDELSQPLIQEWKDREPAIRYYKVEDTLVVEEPSRIPSSIRNMDLETVLVPDANIMDLAVSLESLGIFTIIPEEEMRTKSVVLFGFKGTLGNYLDALSSAYDISFNWKKGNVLSIESASDYILKVPQDESLVDEIKTSLESYGAKEVHYSLQASTVSYQASYESHDRIVDYINKLSLNASVISIQASVVNVSLRSAKSKGFDWSSLQLITGDAGVRDIGSHFNGSNDTSSLTSSSTTSDNSSDSGDDSSDDSDLSISDVVELPGKSIKDTLALVGLTSSGGTLNLAKGDMYFSAALNFLSTYGDTETRQSVLMKTISGKETGISSADSVPYIDNVGTQGSQNGYTNGNGFGSTNVKTVDVGLDLTLKPYYDAATEIVTIDLKLSLSTLLGFEELQAGNQVGKITYPRVQKQEFEDIIKLRAGEPVIVGGITFDSFSDNRSNPRFLDGYDTASQSTDVSRNAMFILLRPTVTLFGNFDQSERIVTKE